MGFVLAEEEEGDRHGRCSRGMMKGRKEGSSRSSLLPL